MIMVVFRILFFIGLAVAAYFILSKLLTPSEYIRCSRCDGKGFWLAARGKETCDWCKGSGRLPRKSK